MCIVTINAAKSVTATFTVLTAALGEVDPGLTAMTEMTPVVALGGTPVVMLATTATAEITAIPSPIAPVIAEPTPVAILTETPTAIFTPEAALPATLASTPTFTPGVTPIVTQTETLEVAPTETATVAPVDTHTPLPTEPVAAETLATPTEVPTEMPTEIPTEVPTEVATEMPIEVPTGVPTEMPTAPLAVDDAVIAMGATLTLDVTANDSDPVGGGLTVVSVAAPQQGAAAVGEDGRTVIYTPALGYAGVDSFTYTVVDAAGQQATGLVAVSTAVPFEANGEEPELQPRLYLPSIHK